MALNSVRVQFNGTWYNMALNSSTGKYEATVTAPDTPTENVPILIRAINSDGYQSELKTEITVREEIIAPTVFIVSPATGLWYTDYYTQIVFNITDSGGSGVDLNSLSFILDSEELNALSPGMSYTSITGGYSFVYSKPGGFVEGQHTLYISIKDFAGNLSNTADVSFGIDAFPPQISISSPENGLVTTEESVVVIGHAYDAGGGISSVTVNNEEVQVNDGDFSVTVHLSEGQNQILAIAKDILGNSSQILITVSRAIHGPSILITYPQNGFATIYNTIEITGTVTDNVSQVSSVEVNGTTAEITGNTFSASVSLVDGVNSIVVTAYNAVGLSTTETISVILDNENPILTVLTPAENEILPSNTVTVSGTLLDAGSGIYSLTVNGNAVQVDLNNTFTTTVSILDGAAIISVIAKDFAGNTSKIDRNITVDTSPPDLIIDSPQDFFITSNNTLVVSGQASDPISGVSFVKVNGINAQVFENSFTLEVELYEGENEISVTAGNGAGLLTTVTRKVTLDTIPPSLTVNSPTNGQIVTNPVFELSGSVYDETSGVQSVTINGEEVTLIDGNFSKLVSLLEGNNNFIFSATDYAGLKTEVSVSVTLDTVGPSLSVSYPSDNYITNNSILTILGTSYDVLSGLVAITINGNPAEVVEGSFSYTTTLTEGINNFEIIATDAVGNYSTVYRSVLLDTISPKFESVTIKPDLNGEIGNSFVITVVMAPSPVEESSTETITGTVNGIQKVFTKESNYTWTTSLSRSKTDQYVVSLHASDEAGNTADYSNTFECGLGSKWTWTQLDYLNYYDLNRIEYNTLYLYKWFISLGYKVQSIVTKTDWTKQDEPVMSDVMRIRENVDYLKDLFFEIPEWRKIVYNNTINASQMNAFEWDLHLIDIWLARMVSQFVYSNEIYSNEY